LLCIAIPNFVPVGDSRHALADYPAGGCAQAAASGAEWIVESRGGQQVTSDSSVRNRLRPTDDARLMEAALAHLEPPSAP